MSLLDLLLLVSIVMMPMDASTMLPYRVFGVGVSVSRIVLVIAFASLVMYSLIKRKVPVLHSLRLLFIWLAWYIISMLWGVNIAEFSSILKQLFIIVFVVMMAVMSGIEEKKGNLGKALVLILFLSVSFALVEQFTGYRPPASRQYYFATQLVGFFFNSSFLGCTIALLIPWALDLDNGRCSLVVKIVLLGLSFYVVIRTASFGALGCALISCATYFVSKQGIKGLGKVVVIFVVTWLVLLQSTNLGIIPESNLEKLSNFTQLTETRSYSSRMLIWGDAANRLRGHVLFGYGMGTAEEILGYSAHNLILEIWLESGVVGVLLFSIMMVLTLLKLAFAPNGSHSKLFFSSLLGSIPVWLTVGSVLYLWTFWAIIGGALACAFGREGHR